MAFCCDRMLVHYVTIMYNAPVSPRPAELIDVTGLWRSRARSTLRSIDKTMHLTLSFVSDVRSELGKRSFCDWPREVSIPGAVAEV